MVNVKLNAIRAPLPVVLNQDIWTNPVHVPREAPALCSAVYVLQNACACAGYNLPTSSLSLLVEFLQLKQLMRLLAQRYLAMSMLPRV